MNTTTLSYQNQVQGVDTTTPPLIEIKDLKKAFGDYHVLNGFNLNLYENENIVIVGKSGSGKTLTSFFIKNISPLKTISKHTHEAVLHP